MTHFPIMSLPPNLLASPDVVDATVHAAGDLTLRRRLVPFQEVTGEQAPDAYTRYALPRLESAVVVRRGCEV